MESIFSMSERRYRYNFQGPSFEWLPDFQNDDSRFNLEGIPPRNRHQDYYTSRWWNFNDFLFSLLFEEGKISNSTHIFQRGWFNHQPVNFGICTNIVIFLVSFFCGGRSLLLARWSLESQTPWAILTSFKKDWKLWVVSLPSNSHHQDYNIFGRGSRPKPSFAIIAGKVGQPNWDLEMTETYSCPVKSNEINLVSCFILDIILFS